MNTTKESAPRVRPVYEGPFRIDGDTWSKRLHGARCRECGTVTLMRRAICPHCWKADTQEATELSDRGKLYSYTIVRNPPAGMPGPYAIAYVDLPENIRLMVRGSADLDAAAIGRDVAIEVKQIGTDEDGVIVVGPVLGETITSEAAA
jgi:uncharacterized protein